MSGKISLTPEEAFILSRVNGQMKISDISKMVSFPIQDVLKMFERFESQGIVGWATPSLPQKSVITSTPETKSNVSHSKNSIDRLLDQEDSDWDLLGIPREFRKKIREYSKEMEKKNYFEILGLTQNASVVEIKSSYLKLAKEFHPDRFFGKKIGEYSTILPLLFEKITESYEAIHSEDLKREYIKKLNCNLNQPIQATRSNKPVFKFEKKVEFKIAQDGSQYEMGMKEEGKGNLKAALNFYQMAMSLKPEEKTYEHAYYRLKKKLKDQGDLI